MRGRCRRAFSYPDRASCHHRCGEKSDGNRCLLIAIAIVVASCATAAGYEQLFNSWAGAQEVELVRSWGPPAQTYEASGRKLIVYESRRNLQLQGTATSHTSAGATGGSPAMDIEMFCTKTFGLESSKVISWSSKGDDCNAKKGAFSPMTPDPAFERPATGAPASAVQG